MTHESEYTWIDTRLGRVLLMGQCERLCGAWFDAQRYAPVIGDDWQLRSESSFLRDVAAQLRAYFDGVRHTFDIPVAPKGTPFQKSIWDAIAAIPYGETATYAQLATRAGRPHAVRAAGAATGRNPLSVVIPCHRVIGTDGSLTGYAGGLDRKRALLALEGRNAPILRRVA